MRVRDLARPSTELNSNVMLMSCVKQKKVAGRAAWLNCLWQLAAEVTIYNLQFTKSHGDGENSPDKVMRVFLTKTHLDNCLATRTLKALCGPLPA